MADASLALPALEPDEVAFHARGPATRAVAPLKRGGRIVGMTKGQFSLLDLLRALLELTGPAEVWLSTWTAGIRDARNAGLLLDAGLITSLHLLVDRSFASRQPRYCAAVRKLFGDRAIRCTRTHAKIAILRGGGWNLVVRSSMNLNRNPRFEQYDVDDSEGLADFFALHFQEMEEMMPEGPIVPTHEVDAVFDRVRRGLNPFEHQVERAWLLERGAPLDGSAAEFFGWVRLQLRAIKRRRGSPSSMAALAESVGVSRLELKEHMGRAPSSWPAMAEDVAHRLVSSGECDERR